jgi:dienelactone hydrolase
MTSGDPVAEIVLFHHVHGLTPGVTGFADDLRSAGHTVHTPDLFDGRTFASIEEGMAHADQVGRDRLLDRGVRAAENLPTDVVYAGFSFGVLPAQKLTQTRPGARGGLFFHACVAPASFGPWPDGVPAQIHAMADDPFFEKGDWEAAGELAGAVSDAELYRYPGNQHLFTDRSLPAYDAEAARLLSRRVLDFLSRGTGQLDPPQR